MVGGYPVSNSGSTRPFALRCGLSCVKIIAPSIVQIKLEWFNRQALVKHANEFLQLGITKQDWLRPEPIFFRSKRNRIWSHARHQISRAFKSLCYWARLRPRCTPLGTAQPSPCLNVRCRNRDEFARHRLYLLLINADMAHHIAGAAQ